ncbi:leucine-rich repeat-containing G-protein coupled receptor 5 isoform X3 [Hermetia illucens]|nr:leucine-rich repeat-containing G-protein coupled receptor 5 isoform X3 [Hermetia illucens]
MALGAIRATGNYLIRRWLLSLIGGFRVCVSVTIVLIAMCAWLKVSVGEAATTPVAVTADESSITSDGIIRETVVLPSSDSEREAQELYEKTLRDYNVREGRTLRKICEPWLRRGCQCSGDSTQVKLVCRGLGFLDIPLDIPEEVIHLDLGSNNITYLAAKSFQTLQDLEELVLSDNIIAKIDKDAFRGLIKLKRLSLQNCGLTVVPSESFKSIPNLVSLQLNGNALTHMDDGCLKYLQHLRSLRLEGNRLDRVPTEALNGLKSLEALNLGNNYLSTISEGDFPHMHNLVVLLLKRNKVVEMRSGSLSNLTNLKVLELDDNLLTSLPAGLNTLNQLQDFSASNNRIKTISYSDLPRNLVSLELRGNPLAAGGIKQDALMNMTRLRKLTLSDVRNLKEFPTLDGCMSLEVIRLDRAGIEDVPESLCRHSSRLRSLELKTNRLKRIPDLHACRELRLLDLSNNRIDSLHGKPFQGLGQLHDLLVSYNLIETIPYDAFVGIPKLQVLDLEGNRINFIHDNAFTVFTQLEDLNLGNNIFPNLPTNGLNRLLHLKTFNNPKLREFPSPEVFPRIQTLVLSYAYHCCPFLPLVAASQTSKTPQLFQEAVLFPSDSEFDMSLWNNSLTDIWPQLHNISKKFGPQINELWDSFGQDFIYPGNLPAYVEEYFEEDNMNTIKPLGSEVTPGSIQCLPLPGPFLPCRDLFDWWTLRCGVWVVFLLAMLGNGTVVFVLIFSRSKMDVPRFLVCNLAAADFFMGVYLGLLAIVDASTLGEFRMYAIPWQMSVVCQLAGFLAVLSSELSVYTLAVITLERNYAITHAIHLNKRLSLRQASYIMLFGWIFAITMATLPLFGISDYRKFAVCLPFETTTGIGSLIYVVALMFINGCAFLTLMGCYLKMYWAIRGSQAWNTNDSRIAKRMALLVFTDFLCWSPIAFFALTATFGVQLVSLEQAKIFTVFVLPLNSCCNPFLYAIMTKQFKKDCVMICKAIEESRVSRTIGRCERPRRELPPLIPAPPGCRCVKMLQHDMPRQARPQPERDSLWTRTWNRLLCNKDKSKQKRRAQRTDLYTYQFAELRRNKKNSRASSISSENFCSSRSSSWRNGPPPPHNCAIPMRLMDSRRRHSAWLITRKTSQDSNLSSSRNDSSASATTASTSTFRLSRSSAGSTTPLPSIIGTCKSNSSGSKPRLVRQQAVQEEEDSSPPRLGVRFLPTIPSAADSSVAMEEDSHENSASSQFYTVLQSGGAKAVLSSPKDKKKPP